MKRSDLRARFHLAAGLLLVALWPWAPLQAASLGNFSHLGISNVFLIMMENHDWSTISGSPNCPFINNTLLPQASVATQYFTPPGNHPSEPNYIWLVAGTNFGIKDDHAPATNTRDTTRHLAFLLDTAHISWRAYQENISGNDIPITNQYPYAVRHNPFMFFRDINRNIQYVTNHVRPFSELSRDLAAESTAHFNFIAPNVTNDMHDSLGGVSTRIQGDHWLSLELPKLLTSSAFTNGGVIFIAWDEGSINGPAGESDGPLGLIVLSGWAKGRSYTNAIHYTHSSTLRTIQDILGVRPFLGDAANANDLSDLFLPLPGISAVTPIPGGLRLTATNTLAGRAHHLQLSTNLSLPAWQTVSTRTASGPVLEFQHLASDTLSNRFYRVVLQP